MVGELFFWSPDSEIVQLHEPKNVFNFFYAHVVDVFWTRVLSKGSNVHDMAFMVQDEKNIRGIMSASFHCWYIPHRNFWLWLCVYERSVIYFLCYLTLVMSNGPMHNSFRLCCTKRQTCAGESVQTPLPRWLCIGCFCACAVDWAS